MAANELQIRQRSESSADAIHQCCVTYGGNVEASRASYLESNLGCEDRSRRRQPEYPQDLPGQLPVLKKARCLRALAPNYGRVDLDLVLRDHRVDRG